MEKNRMLFLDFFLSSNAAGERKGHFKSSFQEGRQKVPESLRG